MTTRIVAIDYGLKRIGIAISDPLRITAQPLPFIPNNANTMDAFQSLMDQYEVSEFLIGLPKNQHGDDSKQALLVRQFADALQDVTDIKITFWDERFSTQAVTKHLIAAGVSRQKRKQVIDSQSAVFILQGYLDSLV